MKKYNKTIKVIHFGQKNCMSREGGVEIVVGEVAKRQVQSGLDVTCINRTSHHISGNQYDSERTKIWNGVKIKYALTIDKKGLAAVTSSFFASLKASFSDCDIVHIHAEGPCIFSFIPRLFGKKVVCHVHGLDWKRDKWKNSFASKFIHYGEKNLAKFANAIIVLNKSTKRYFKDEYNRNTFVINNGVDKSKLVELNIISKKYGLSKNSYILYLSRLVPEKRCDLLINAYNSLKTNKKLVIAGSPSDTNEFYDGLLKLANNNQNIIFTGFVQGDELAELYSNAYLYVLPSDIEGMPLSLLEAMSYNNCCITSDIEEISEVMNDKGLYFKKGSISELIGVLNKALDNENMVNEYKNMAGEYICKNYSWDETVSQIIEIYSKLLVNEIGE